MSDFDEYDRGYGKGYNDACKDRDERLVELEFQLSSADQDIDDVTAHYKERISALEKQVKDLQESLLITWRVLRS
jgi:archaellum component FlaC